jgi:O-succinylbenzoate synthase
LTIDEDIDRIAGVRKIVGPEALLRLDANRSWSVRDALNFMARAAEFNIEYIEEPVQDFNHLKMLLKDGSPSLPVALDESLMQITPRILPRLPALKAIVIKPTLLGLDRALRFSRKAQDIGITPVISSSFESSLGLFTLASMAAGINGGQVPAGLDTLDWLAEDVLEPPLQIQAGKIYLADDSSLTANIKMDLLEKIK